MPFYFFRWDQWSLHDSLTTSLKRYLLLPDHSLKYPTFDWVLEFPIQFLCLKDQGIYQNEKCGVCVCVGGGKGIPCILLMEKENGMKRLSLQLILILFLIKTTLWTVWLRFLVDKSVHLDMMEWDVRITHGLCILELRGLERETKV